MLVKLQHALSKFDLLIRGKTYFTKLITSLAFYHDYFGYEIIIILKYSVATLRFKKIMSIKH